METELKEFDENGEFGILGRMINAEANVAAVNAAASEANGTSCPQRLG